MCCGWRVIRWDCLEESPVNLFRPLFSCQISLPWIMILKMCMDLSSALNYLHTTALVSLVGFDERDVNVYSLMNCSKQPGSRLKLSLARVCRDHDGVSSHPTTIQQGMQEDIRSLGQVMASVIYVLQLARHYNGPRIGLEPAGLPTLQVDCNAMHHNVALLILSCINSNVWSRPFASQVLESLDHPDSRQLRHAIQLPKMANVRGAVTMTTQGQVLINCSNQVGV